MKTQNVKTKKYKFFNYFKTKKDVEQYSKNGMEVVYVVLPSDVEEFLKEHNFEVKYQIGGGGSSVYIYEVYVSKEHQLVVVPINMYGDDVERYEVYTFEDYENDVHNHMWVPSEEYPIFVPYLHNLIFNK
jgi:hypothetical protein